MMMYHIALAIIGSTYGVFPLHVSKLLSDYIIVMYLCMTVPTWLHGMYIYIYNCNLHCI